jgi:hypothetical protein
MSTNDLNFDILFFDILMLNILLFSILLFNILLFSILLFNILFFNSLLFDILPFGMLDFDKKCITGQTCSTLLWGHILGVHEQGNYVISSSFVCWDILHVFNIEVYLP